MKSMKYILNIMKYIFLIVIVIISVIPILWVFMSSFKTNSEILTSAFSLPKSFNLSNYYFAFKTSPLVTFYLNSVIVSCAATILNLIIIGMAAYVLARWQFKGSNILMLLLSVTLMIPNTALLLPLYRTITKIGLYNNIFGLILVYTGFGIPITLYVMRSYFLTIPKELEESAMLDGASMIRTYIQIIVPIAKPAFSTAGILQFIACWNEFQFAMVLTSGNKSRTLPVALNYFTSQLATNYGALFAATMVICIPTIVIYCLLQEQVVSGLADGAVKG